MRESGLGKEGGKEGQVAPESVTHPVHHVEVKKAKKVEQQHELPKTPLHALWRQVYYRWCTDRPSCTDMLSYTAVAPQC